MTIGVLALVGVTPERVAALTAAGYAVREGKKYANRTDAVREAADTVRAVLTNGRGGLSGDEMAATRHLLEADRFVRAGGWQDQWRVETPTITGKRLGILGLGKIGSRIAQRAARGFDMEIGYHNRAAVAGSPYRYFASLIELATWADFLVAAAPGGAGTRHLVNADVLAALGPHGYLVNVGRGTVVDTQALIDALRAKRIAGAGLDVLEGEPSVPPLLPELLQCDNVVVTPHVAGRAPESRTAATALILANLNAHFAGKPLPSPVLIKA
jgi:lactate dehydrogenase-like 2-hydroxyacid dehydrogenase